MNERDTTSSVFDRSLAVAVKRFQSRHGLVVDGIVGRETRAALNVGADIRLRQITASLDRLRSIPDIPGNRIILINVASFELGVLENGHAAPNSAVIVGRASRPTPTLSTAVTRITINPYWRVPRRIAINDLLPQIRRDPTYLIRHGYKVFTASADTPVEVAVGEVDWKLLNRNNFPYVLVQDPGASNALGRVRFFFPNDQDIFMHDTPARNLFEYRVRAFSSGCIRVSKAVDLAAHLLEREGEGPYQAMAAALQSGETQHIKLNQPVPLHIFYLTAWVDGGGQVHFRNDMYGLDAIADSGRTPQEQVGRAAASAYEAAGTECASGPEPTANVR